MKILEIKELINRSLDATASTSDIPGKLEEGGVILDFNPGFSDRVIDKLFAVVDPLIVEREYVRKMSYIFYRIALSGVAAIIFVLLSIFLMEGSLSFNSFLGIGETNEESIVCLLTGN
jgi:hypothetical protein